MQHCIEVVVINNAQDIVDLQVMADTHCMYFNAMYHSGQKGWYNLHKRIRYCINRASSQPNGVCSTKVYMGNILMTHPNNLGLR